MISFRFSTLSFLLQKIKSEIKLLFQINTYKTCKKVFLLTKNLILFNPNYQKKNLILVSVFSISIGCCMLKVTFYNFKFSI